MPLLDKAEYFRANFKHDSSVLQLIQAQKEYQKTGLNYELLCLYPQILLCATESIKLDSLFFQGQLNEFNQQRLSNYPEDKWLERRYYLSAYMVYSKYDNPKLAAQYQKKLSTITIDEDWELAFFYHIDNFSASDPSTKGSALLAYDLLIKYIAQIDTKIAHRYYLYNHYLWYAYDNVFDYYLYGKDYEKALDFGYKSLVALERQPYLDSVFYSTTFTQ